MADLDKLAKRLDHWLTLAALPTADPAISAALASACQALREMQAERDRWKGEALWCSKHAVQRPCQHCTDEPLREMSRREIDLRQKMQAERDAALARAKKAERELLVYRDVVATQHLADGCSLCQARIARLESALRCERPDHDYLCPTLGAPDASDRHGCARCRIDAALAEKEDPSHG